MGGGTNNMIIWLWVLTEKKIALKEKHRLLLNFNELFENFHWIMHGRLTSKLLQQVLKPSEWVPIKYYYDDGHALGNFPNQCHVDTLFRFTWLVSEDKVLNANNLYNHCVFFGIW